ncbi:restriction endonuclease subunit S [Flavobacterium sp. 25HG05S-40]|uniref:restriction endonuclease subunit S n=1 Tax=Flavobacterium sp. 25HG05S-40 TaxID=3458682 RepID=UPI0040451635
MQLLEHFASLTLHPKNAQELKGLIMQLAIQGKLTANWREVNPDIETASELLKRTQIEKEQLVKDKILKKEQSLPEIDNEVPFQIPIKWKWDSLGALGSAQTGTTPPTKNPENYGTFIPFLGPADISNSSMLYPEEGLSEAGLKKGRLIESNSLMMVCIGGSMGKCNINRKDVSCNQQINILTPIFSLVEYVKIVCQSPYFQNEVWNRSTGSATPMINKNKWLQIPVSIPPLEEQNEIVRVVEILFKEVEQLEQFTVERIRLKEEYVSSALQQLITQNTQKEWQSLQQHFKDFVTEKSTIKKLRETVLQLAVQGKLTAYWRTKNTSVEHATEFLKRIQKEKAQLIKEKKIKKESPLPTISKEEIPYELPEGWVWCRLNDLGIIGSSSRVHQKDWQSKGVPFYRAREIVKLSKFGYVDNDLFITEELFNKFKENGSVPELNDVMITGVGTIGIPYIVNKEDRFYFKDASVLIFKNIFNLYSDYLNLFFSCQYWKNEIHKDSMGTTVHTLTISRAKLVPTILPPSEEQKAIVEKVNALMSLCDALEQEVEQSKVHSEQLMQSVLREVFETNATN